MISRGEIRFVWMMDWYDGPIAGLATYKGKLCYFKIIEEPVWQNVKRIDEDSGEEYEDSIIVIPRKYALCSMTPRQVVNARLHHELFQKYVGKHWDYDENGQAVNDDVSDNPLHNYKLYKELKEMLETDFYDDLPTINAFYEYDIDDNEYYDQGYP